MKVQKSAGKAGKSPKAGAAKLQAALQRSAATKAGSRNVATATKIGGFTVTHATAEKDAELKEKFEAIAPGSSQYYFRVRDLVASAQRANVMVYWRIGKELGTVATKYSPGVTKAFAAHLAIDADTLRKARALADTYEEDRLKVLCDLQGPNGERLSWGHFRQALAIRSDDKRENLLRRAIEKSQSVRDFTAAVHRALGKKTPGSHTPLRLPKTCHARIMHVRAMTEKLADHVSKMLGPELERLEKQTPLDEWPETSLEDLEAAESLFATMVDQLEREKHRVEAIRKRLQSAVSRLAEPEATGATNGRAVAAVQKVRRKVRTPVAV